MGKHKYTHVTCEVEMDARLGNFPLNESLSCYKLSIKNTGLYYLRLHRTSKGLTFELILIKGLSVSSYGGFINTFRKQRASPSVSAILD